MSLSLAGSVHRKVIPVVAAFFLWGCSQSSAQKHSDYMESGREYSRQGDYARAALQFKNALRALPDDPETHYELGRALLATNNPAEAVQAFLKATELDPRHARAQLNLAELMLAAGKEKFAPDAAERLEVVLSESPDNSHAHFVMAAAQMRMGSNDEAERHLQEALRNSPEHLRSTVALATMKLARKDIEGAEEVVKSAVERSPDAAEPVLALGHLYVLTNRYDEAEQQFQKALDIAPNHPPSMLAMAGLYLRRGREPEAADLYRRVSALSTPHRTAYAEFLIHQGQEERAIPVLEELYRSNTEDRNTRSRLVATYLATSRRNDAKKLLNSVLDGNPSDVHARLQRGYLNLLDGEIGGAESDLSDVVRNQPDWGVARYLLSRVHQANGSVRLQRQELETALDLDPSNLAVRLDLARSLLSQGASQSALDLLGQMPEEQTALLPSVITRNWALMAANEWMQVREGIDKGLAIKRAPELVLQDGIDRLRRGDLAAARASFTETLNENPAEVRAMVALAQTYAAQGQHAMAAEQFDQYASKAPNSSRAQRSLGDWLVKNGDFAGARKAYEAAIAGEPPDAMGTRLKLAQLDVSEKKFRDAHPRLETILAIDPANSSARLLLGIAEEALENHEAARGHYQQVIKDDPANIIALNNLAYRLATDTQDLNEALAFAQRAKEAAPDNHSVSDTLGWIYYLKGVYEAALPHLEAAASGLPGVASVHYHLAMVHYKLGDRQRAEEVLRGAEALGSTASPEAQAARRLIEKGEL